MTFSIKTRRLIMLAFFGVFVIGAPLLVLYASGFRYDLKRHGVVRTGTLFLETAAATDASIYINDVLYQSTLRKKIYIYNLLPGTYRIRLQKEGYHEWSGEVNIASSLTTFVKDIVLFPASGPTAIEHGRVTSVAAAHADTSVAYIVTSAQGASLRVQKKEATAPTELRRFDLDTPVSEISWSANDRYIAVQSPRQLSILSAMEPFAEYTLAIPEGAAWAWDGESDERLFLIEKNTLIAFNAITGQRTVVATTHDREKLQPSVWTAGRAVYFVTDDGVQTIVYEYHTLLKTVTLVSSTPSLGSPRIMSIHTTALALEHATQHKARMVKLSAAGAIAPVPQQLYTDTAASAIIWNSSGDIALLVDYGELSVITPSDLQKKLLTRYGGPIKTASFIPETPYVVIALGDRVLTHELQSLTFSTPLTLAADITIDSAVITSDGADLYFAGTTGNIPGLYRLQLQKR